MNMRAMLVGTYPVLSSALARGLGAGKFFLFSAEFILNYLVRTIYRFKETGGKWGG